jgi:hypothetical protein
LFLILVLSFVTDMSKQHHEHRDHHHQQPAPRAAWHKDWRTWVVVGLMLVAMLVYVMSFDEELQPGGVEGERVPAAAE